jgi:uncharacterized membrane protein
MRRALAALLLFAAPAAALAQEPVPQMLHCVGEEPFWGLRANATTGLWSEPGAEALYQGTLDMLDWLEPGWLAWHGAGAAGPLVAVLRREACHSTMADGPPRDYRAILVRGARTMAGCCTVTVALDAAAAPVADLAAKDVADWSRLLADLQPGITRCLVDGGPAWREITTAWPMNRGLMGVRGRAADGGLHQCIVEMGGGRIDRVERLAEPADTLPGEGRPVFLPAREQPPMVLSGRLERVIDARGVLQGWLHYRE